MKTYTIETAQNKLDQLLSDAHNGQTVLITAKDGWAVKLVPTPVRANKPRKAGSAQGQVWMSDDFDDPLDDFAEYMR